MLLLHVSRQARLLQQAPVAGLSRKCKSAFPHCLWKDQKRPAQLWGAGIGLSSTGKEQICRVNSVAVHSSEEDFGREHQRGSLREIGGTSPGIAGKGISDDILWEELVTLETNIDDMSPQLVAYTIEKLLAEGALDAWAVQEQANVLLKLLFQETSSLGVRVGTCERASLPRSFIKVETPWGHVNVKTGFLEGKLVNVHAEYEDCAALARLHAVPLKAVFAAAHEAFSRQHNAQGKP